MEIRFQPGGPAKWQAEAVGLFLFEEDLAGDHPLDRLCPSLLEAAPWLGIAPAVRDFKARKDDLAVIYGHPDHNLPRVILVGLGKSDSFPCEAMRLEAIRKAAAAMARACRELGLETCALSVPGLVRLANERYPLPRLVEEVVAGSLLGLYRYTALKTRKPGEPELHDPRWMALCLGEDVPGNELVLAVKRGEAAAMGTNLARNLVNAPGNAVTPVFMADEARKVALRHDMRFEIFDRDGIESLGMGALLAVGAGSENEPRFIVMEHAPKGHEHDKPLVVVGKGITFDSGGISLKPAANMHEMKGDMSGAAAVLGLFEVLGLLDVPRRVVGLLACAENMPDGRATRPGDVVLTLAGKTVEITNTDAEGRLVLCDALTYAQRHWQPEALIDIATLTGACLVALGPTVAGLFSPDPVLTERVRGVGQTVGELYWPMPVWDRYFENLKSDVADFVNSGPREGGACTAAVFLKQFIEPGTRWAHLDIAGKPFGNKKELPAGATGFGVRTLVELALHGLPK